MKLPASLAAAMIALTGMTAHPVAQTSAPSTETASYSSELRLLRSAADSLRDAAQALAATGGEERVAAIQQVNDALAATQEAMLSLPLADMFVSDPGVEESAAVAHLNEAAEKLRNATQAIAEEGKGKERGQAMRAATEALLEARQAVANLSPPTK